MVTRLLIPSLFAFVAARAAADPKTDFLAAAAAQNRLFDFEIIGHHRYF